MDRLIYTSMSGAVAAMQRQSVLASNLANASTPGFRAELTNFRAMPLKTDGPTTRVFAVEGGSGQLNTPGAAQRTERNLDLFATGNAWFAVQGLDGLEAYSRAGSLSVTAEGTLVNSQGLQMLDDGGAPIVVPTGGELSVSAEGQVSVMQDGQPGSPLGTLKLVTPSAEAPLQRGLDGLFRSADGQALAVDPQARLEAGAIEGSNVNSVEAMVAMIQAARQFEAQMRLIQSAETNDKTAAQLLSLN